MHALKLLPVILSFLLLAAHFFRAGHMAGVLLCLVLPLLLFLRQTWVPRLVQFLLALGALEWLRSLYFLVSMRAAIDQPWTRLAAILGVVAFFTLLSGLVFRAAPLRRFYGTAKTKPE